MEKPTEQAIAKLVEFLTVSLQQGKDFAIDQAPDLAKQILAWEFMQGYICLGVAGLFFITTIIFLWITLKRDSEAIFPTIIFGVLFFAVCICGLIQVAKCNVSPKLVILDNLKRF